MKIDGKFMRDLVYGSAVGDALGVPFEFLQRDTFECKGIVGYGTHNQPAGTWSDDTSLMIATCESIVRNGKIDTEDMLGNFRSWLSNGSFTPFGEVFDCGNTTAEAIRSGQGKSGEWDSGNGSLMRIAPLAAIDCTDAEIREVSAITHATELCMNLCVSFVHMLRDVRREPERARSIVSDSAPVLGKKRGEIASSGFVQHTYDAAAWCFLTTGSYEECVLKAVNLGSDTDTTACVAGALAVACYGFDSIPSEWVASLQAAERLDDAICR